MPRNFIHFALEPRSKMEIVTIHASFFFYTEGCTLFDYLKTEIDILHMAILAGAFATGIG